MSEFDQYYASRQIAMREGVHSLQEELAREEVTAMVASFYGEETRDAVINILGARERLEWAKFPETEEMILVGEHELEMGQIIQFPANK